MLVSRLLLTRASERRKPLIRCSFQTIAYIKIPNVLSSRIAQIYYTSQQQQHIKWVSAQFLRWLYIMHIHMDLYIPTVKYVYIAHLKIHKWSDEYLRVYMKIIWVWIKTYETNLISIFIILLFKSIIYIYINKKLMRMTVHINIKSIINAIKIRSHKYDDDERNDK